MSGSVILKVDSKCVADSIWYFPLLQPYIDHVPVKADLSNLLEQIEWCRNNDEKCHIIAQNAYNLYNKYISRNGILDYLQAICIEISKRTLVAPSYATGGIVHLPPPDLRDTYTSNNSNSSKGNSSMSSSSILGTCDGCEMCYTCRRVAGPKEAERAQAIQVYTYTKIYYRHMYHILYMYDLVLYYECILIVYIVLIYYANLEDPIYVTIYTWS